MPSPAISIGIIPAPRRAMHSLPLRLACLLVFAGWIASLEGCMLGRFILRRPHDQMASVPRPHFSTDPQLEEVVDHLNRNVDKLHAWRAHGVRIRANNMPLSGTLAVEEGQHLRLVVNSIAGHEVDMGSNNDVFWIWAKRMEPSYVYCRHEQIDAARQSLGVPFEPQWLMQALGVAPLDTEGLTMQIDPTRQHARLVQPVVTAHGHPLQKVMQVDLVHGIITEHSIYDAHGQKVAQARLEDFRLDKSSGVVLPHRVKLDWPQNQMSLVMNMGHIEVNPPAIPSQIWEMPCMPGEQLVDLGRASQAGVRNAAQGTQVAVRLKEPEDDAPIRDAPLRDAPAHDNAGHAQLSLDDGGKGWATDSGGELEEPFHQSNTVAPVEHRTHPFERHASPIERQTLPVERPAQRNWWDE
jgi:hypothetical protein